jgi:hypothetical protein
MFISFQKNRLFSGGNFVLTRGEGVTRGCVVTRGVGFSPLEEVRLPVHLLSFAG